MTDFVFMGMDTETTGTQSQSEIIQIGLYINDQYTYVSDVGHRANFYYEPKAFEINRFTFQRIYNAPPVYTVDGELDEFITKVKKDFQVTGDDIIPVGFNVGSFDIPLIRRTFKLFYSGLSYRSLDLNAVLFAKSQGNVDFKENKENFKNHAKSEMISTAEEHDALYDAELAIRYLAYLRG